MHYPQTNREAIDATHPTAMDLIIAYEETDLQLLLDELREYALREDVNAAQVDEINRVKQHIRAIQRWFENFDSEIEDCPPVRQPAFEPDTPLTILHRIADRTDPDCPSFLRSA